MERYHDLLAILAVLGGMLVGAWFLLGLNGARVREEEPSRRSEEFADDMRVLDFPIPPVVVTLVAMLALSLVTYFLVVWWKGMSY